MQESEFIKLIDERRGYIDGELFDIDDLYRLAQQKANGRTVHDLCGFICVLANRFRWCHRDGTQPDKRAQDSIRFRLQWLKKELYGS
jgi:hypothetical protein